MKQAVELRDLKKSFHTRAASKAFLPGAVCGLVSAKTTVFRAVDGISFSIARGERVALIGPNGADKPELSLTLAGGRVIGREPHKSRLEMDVRLTPVVSVVAAALAQGTLHDLAVEDPPLEPIVQAIYEGTHPANDEPEPERRAS